MLKAGGVVVEKWLKQICDKVWPTGVWLSEWQITEMIMLLKVSGTRDCTKHRTISLISHASKVLLSILQRRLAHFIHPEISGEQFGFMLGRGTAEAILSLRNIIEKVFKRQQQELWIFFIDYSKAFDTVDHAVMWKALKDMRAPQHLIWLLRKLYDAAEATTRVEDQHTPSFRLQRGVRQGCLVSPMLLVACGESIMRRVERENGGTQGCIIGGRSISNISYADDTAILATSKQELEAQATALQRHSQRFGLEINWRKTKVVVVGLPDEAQPQCIRISGVSVDMVKQYKYLGSMVNQQGDSEQDVRTRIATAKNVTVN